MNEFPKKSDCRQDSAWTTDSQEVPGVVRRRIRQTLLTLPDPPRKRRSKKLFLSVGFSAVLVLCTLFALPNLFPSVTCAAEQLPVFSNLVQVITARKNTVSDPYHEADLLTPELTVPNGNQPLQEAAEEVNREVKSLTDTLLSQFLQDAGELKEDGHTALCVHYDVLTNTETWFTIRITVWEGSGSSNTYYKFYHIDKTSGRIVSLSDLFGGNYREAFSKEVLRQMQEENAEKGGCFWVDSESVFEPFSQIDLNQNFYFDSQNRLILVFNKYEVAPGAAGCPEFAIEPKLWKAYLK